MDGGLREGLALKGRKERKRERVAPGARYERRIQRALSQSTGSLREVHQHSWRARAFAFRQAVGPRTFPTNRHREAAPAPPPHTSIPVPALTLSPFHNNS